jgi:hypothetical protein
MLKMVMISGGKKIRKENGRCIKFKTITDF